ncbi:MAG: sigma-54-dependent Fis family transcriptional regulator [candidate division Zixibacteria bacterium]|nr:sigma-54-dependent Fis family transcriptional regulator [candidate division Zixibacteria bacterium]NIR63202.1 sigma-54-dependent Fis family transcriptional regulator [candidate division Zixibacteria bacterium]NIS16900.1 sigma-54-dependent Fis family transcriptional regulator [candidate division Zixibacteria bacterium]NIS45179.1 sigma-54-dependent Fis family transcriptional regulator [candidate division Zixibacteria bacterium]NIT51752.1 sigma-54-dependent Fis family transcriptional regulator 
MSGSLKNVCQRVVMSSVLVIDDKESIRKMLSQTLVAEGHEVESAANGFEGIKKSKSKQYDVVLTDLKMPDMDGISVLSAVKEENPDASVIVMTAYGTIETAVEAMKRGAFDFLTKPFDTDHLNVLIKRAMETRQLMNENLMLKEALKLNLGEGRIIGTSEKVKEVLKLVQKVAPSDTSVLLIGESGTGKELFARAIHQLSARKEKPFVAINSAAIPSELLENELFGSEKGAFTSSHARHIGKFEIAEGGTIFLDEIGDLHVALQAKILRVLQEKQVERLGGSQTVPVDVRVVAATNMDLQAAIENKEFREDLYYRLSVFPITIPPLRERPEDIESLADYFVDRFCKEMKKPLKQISRDGIKLMERYHWPGNVRELENTVERAIILCEGKKIKPDHLAIRIQTPEEIRLREGAGLREVGQHAQMQAERALILRVLSQTRGNKRKASEALKIDYTTLFEKIKKYKIDPNKEI